MLYSTNWHLEVFQSGVLRLLEWLFRKKERLLDEIGWGFSNGGDREMRVGGSEKI